MPSDEWLTLTTRRCALHPVILADGEALHALWTSAGVRRFLWDDEIITMQRTADAIARSERSFREHQFGLWAARPHGSAELIGFSGLWWFRDPPELELLYGVAEHDWGQGYAVEIARAVLSYSFGSLAMPSVRASTDAANSSSVRVMEKLGFRYVRRDVSSGLDTMFYELTRSDWTHQPDSGV